jgi:hypothetical protein
MADGPLRIGDRVITMQMPGIFTVTGRSGRALDIVSDEGVRLRVMEASLRRMDAAPADAPDADDEA